MSKKNNSNGDSSEDSRKLWPFFFIIPILGLSVLPITGSQTTIIGCNNPPALEQCGTGSCTPNNDVPVLSCIINVTFSPAFAATPKYASAQYTGCHLPECHPETLAFPLGSLSFQSDNGETWANMPVAKTEVYGNTNHEVAIKTQANMASAAFAVGCLTGSANATAILRPEFSTDGGGTWSELSQNTGGLDVLVDATDCGFSASPAFTSNIAGIAPAARDASITLRVVGINGNGVGDIVTFNNLEIVFYGTFSESYTTCIQGAGSFLCGGTAISKTAMQIQVIRLAPALSGAGTSILVNWIAEE